MKKYFSLWLAALLTAGTVSAQSSGSARPHTKNSSQDLTWKARKGSSLASKRNTGITRPDSSARVPDNRTEYMKDGQMATRTGHQATAINSDEYQSIRDRSGKKRKEHQ